MLLVAGSWVFKPCAVPCCGVLFCRFTVLYFVHALYWRDGWRFMGSLWGSNSCGRRFLGEVLQGLFIVWGLAVLSIAWCIGVTRFRDNRHNIDDILVSQRLMEPDQPQTSSNMPGGISSPAVQQPLQRHG